MALDRTSTADDLDEVGEDTDQRHSAPGPPPDRPGQPGAPSRADSRRGAAEANKPPSDATQRTDDRPRLTSRQESAEQQEPAADDDTDSAAPNDNQYRAEQTDHKDTDKPGSPLEELPSYGGFDNLSQEFEARARSHENARAANAEPATDQPDESDETRLTETRHDQDASQAERLPGDELDSWRGDGGQYLNTEENYSVSRVLDRVGDQEPEVTDDLRDIESETNGELTGLEYRLKGEDRFKEKAADTLEAEFRDDPRGAAERIPDAMRYTYQLDRDRYAQGYEGIQQRLKDRGYELMASRNSWDNPEYKGINTRWKTPTGQLFEVQFHTPESFTAKQETHGAYERIRNPLTNSKEIEELEAFQKDVSSKIPIPEGVNEIPSFRKEGF